MVTNILVFGASNTYGAWDPKGGWVGRLRELFDEKNIKEQLLATGNPIFLYNLGIPGDNAEGIAQRLEYETEQRADPEENNIFIVQVGLNDSLFDNKAESLERSPKEFQEDVEKIIRKAGRFSDKIIFVGTLPVDERVDPIPWLEGYSYKNEYVEEYNEIAKSACRINGADFIEIFQKFKGTDFRELLEDGVHGNAKGHKKIFEEIRNYLSTLLTGSKFLD